VQKHFVAVLSRPDRLSVYYLFQVTNVLCVTSRQVQKRFRLRRPVGFVPKWLSWLVTYPSLDSFVRGIIFKASRL